MFFPFSLREYSGRDCSVKVPDCSYPVSASFVKTSLLDCKYNCHKRCQKDVPKNCPGEEPYQFEGPGGKHMYTFTCKREQLEF